MPTTGGVLWRLALTGDGGSPNCFLVVVFIVLSDELISGFQKRVLFAVFELVLDVVAIGSQL